jgi:hypothetical protein
MYSVENFETKKRLREAVKERGSVPCFQPGPFGPKVRDGWHCCEGPHYPEPHKWYAEVLVESNSIIKVKG